MRLSSQLSPLSTSRNSRYEHVSVRRETRTRPCGKHGSGYAAPIKVEEVWSPAEKFGR